MEPNPPESTGALTKTPKTHSEFHTSHTEWKRLEIRRRVHLYTTQKTSKKEVEYKQKTAAPEWMWVQSEGTCRRIRIRAERVM